MSWDWLISVLILIFFFLIIASRATRQSIPELLEGIKDFILGTKDEMAERGEDILYNQL